MRMIQRSIIPWVPRIHHYRKECHRHGTTSLSVFFCLVSVFLSSIDSCIDRPPSLFRTNLHFDLPTHLSSLISFVAPCCAVLCCALTYLTRLDFISSFSIFCCFVLYFILFSYHTISPLSSPFYKILFYSFLVPVMVTDSVRYRVLL